MRSKKSAEVFFFGEEENINISFPNLKKILLKLVLQNTNAGTVSTSYGDIEDVSSESALDQHDTWSSDRFQVSLPSAAEDETGASRKEEEHYRGYWDEYLNLSPHLSWRSQLVTCFPGFWHKVTESTSLSLSLSLPRALTCLFSGANILNKGRKIIDLLLLLSQSRLGECIRFLWRRHRLVL